MLRSLERPFKKFLSTLLRLVIGSAPMSLSSHSSFHRILIVRQHNQLGDMLCIVPTLRALRERFPNSFIALVASPINFEVMRHCRYLDEVLMFDKTRGLLSSIAFIRDLRKRNFDLAIVPSTVSMSFTSHLFAFLSNAHTRIGAAGIDGKENPSAFFFNVPVVLDWRATPHRHQTLRNLDMLKPLAIFSDDLHLEITFDREEAAMMERLKREKAERKKLVIGYHAGAGKTPNRWEASRFARVANTLAQEFDAATLITAGPMDDEPVYDMTKWLTVPYNLIKGKPIREVAVILSTVDLMITNDTGIMHVAGAVGVPVLSLFGPTDPEQWAPVGTKNRWLKGEKEDINTISVEEVLRTSREMLKK